MLTPRFAIYPAIDVLEGRVVRLEQGRRDNVTVEGGDPLAAAIEFAAAGASWLHLVDLDGAFSGAPELELVRRVAAVGLPVQVGGGYRSIELVTAAVEAGAARVVVGTAACRNASLSAAVERYASRLAVAVDARDGQVAVRGWTESVATTPRSVAEQCAAAGVARLVVTQTRRDGTLAGPDLGLLEDVLEAGLPVIAAGGISSLDDLYALRDLRCEGAVVGSAIWRGRFGLADAVSLEA